MSERLDSREGPTHLIIESTTLQHQLLEPPVDRQQIGERLDGTVAQQLVAQVEDLGRSFGVVLSRTPLVS